MRSGVVVRGGAGGVVVKGEITVGSCFTPRGGSTGQCGKW